MRTWFVVKSKDGEDQLLMFHDQIAMVADDKGHAAVTLTSGQVVRFHGFTLERFVRELIVPAYPNVVKFEDRLERIEQHPALSIPPL